MLQVTFCNLESLIVIITYAHTIIVIRAIQPSRCAAIGIERIAIGSVSADVPLDVVSNLTCQIIAVNCNF